MMAYLITNLVNGKRYIGITKMIEHRWMIHKKTAKKSPKWAIHLAMAKYGIDNFEFSEVACAKSWNDLCELEKELIQQYGTYAPRGYNMTKGGAGALGYKHTPDKLKIMSVNRRGKGLGPLSEEHKEKLRIAHSKPEAIAANIARQKGKQQGPPPPGFGGRKHSQETRLKMSMSAKEASARPGVSEARSVRRHNRNESAGFRESLRLGWSRRRERLSVESGQLTLGFWQ
jgi:group I intron endonuclease